MYKCDVCEKEFKNPIEIEECENDNYECLNGFLEYCCPYCKTAINIDKE